MVVISRLSNAAARDRLSNDGAAAMGLAAPLLSPVWMQAAPGPGDFDAAALHLTAIDLLMPFMGILETIDTPRDVFELDGTPVAGPVSRIRLHPQAAARLETLAQRRYAGGSNPLHHPVPVQVVLRAVRSDPEAPRWWEPGDSLSAIIGQDMTGDVSFHDSRGLIVCPVAAAAIYADLLGAFPALITVSPNCPVPGASLASAGGLTAVAGIAGSGTVVHVVDPHGNLFEPILPDRTLTRRNGAAVTQASVAGGLTDLPEGESFAASDADDTAEAALSQDGAHDFDTGARLRWGWSNGGRLARAPLGAPTLAAGTLGRQFLRLTVVDLDWHLLGNRSPAPIAGIPGDDGLIPEAYLPKVRPEVPISYLPDGMATLSAAGQALDTLMADTNDGSILVAVSPVLEPGLAWPPAPTARWPAFPPAPPGFMPSMAANAPAVGISASFVGNGPDVVVTLAADAVAAQAAVRLFPRQYVEILAIGEQPSFLRGDGGAGIAADGLPLSILLEDPLALGAAPPPDPAVLTLDIAVAPRGAPRQLFANVVVPVSGTGAVAPPDPFSVPGNIVDLVQGFVGAIAPTPLFGLENLAPPPAQQPASFIDLVRQHLSEGTPRQGPRLPTQARFETMIATCVAAGSGQFDWDATVSGGRWAAETRSALHNDGNPGNPAGPDVHAPGVRVRGDLGLDVARQAMRRAQPILPLPGAQPMLGWIAMMGGANFNRPTALPPGASASPDLAAGALLKTVAAFCETPEFGPTGFPLTDQPVVAQQQYDALLDAIANALGLANPPDIDFEFGNENRLGSEIVKEIYTARHGNRDALWALRRAFGQARELVYIEGPQFARTAIPEDALGPPAAHMIDLAQVLAQRMDAQRSLRVVICISREGDFAPGYRGWVRQSIAARNEAVQLLRAVDPERVAVFHPKGFPGRAAHIRSTSVVVDDCWSLVGTSHLRRRGMTFDGAADVVSIPYEMTGARATNLAMFRRDLMARKLGLEPSRAADRDTAEWARLWEMDAAFRTIRDLLDQGGAGRVTPLWEGPQDDFILPATPDMADPDGTDGATLFSALAGLFAEMGDA